MRYNKVRNIEALEQQNVFLFNADTTELYDSWARPNVIISDGAYGVSGFKGDPFSHNNLKDWYEPHVKAWSKRATAGTTLWFWNTEIGWATMHSMLEENGWEYVGCNIWNKGIQHIAGNCNLKTLKSYPIVTEVCAQYVKKIEFKIDNTIVTLKDWLRNEWNRAGLTLQQANEACGIANAAGRKYLTKDHLWYAPPVEHFENLANYANENGKNEGKPYFSINKKHPLSKSVYAALFPTFNGKYGITNVWEVPPLHSKERIRVNGDTKYYHLNQKPLQLMTLLIESSSIENDVIWEPFGGLFSASLAAYGLGRKAYAAEINSDIFNIACQRFVSESILENMFEYAYD